MDFGAGVGQGLGEAPEGGLVLRLPVGPEAVGGAATTTQWLR